MTDQLNGGLQASCFLDCQLYEGYCRGSSDVAVPVPAGFRVRVLFSSVFFFKIFAPLILECDEGRVAF